jgi:hypothetical protein
MLLLGVGSYHTSCLMPLPSTSPPPPTTTKNKGHPAGSLVQCSFLPHLCSLSQRFGQEGCCCLVWVVPIGWSNMSGLCPFLTHPPPPGSLLVHSCKCVFPSPFQPQPETRPRRMLLLGVGSHHTSDLMPAASALTWQELARCLQPDPTATQQPAHSTARHSIAQHVTVR